jgi:hypothetical protein
MHVDHIGAQALARDLEGQQRARRILEKGVDDGEAAQRLDPLVGLAVQLDPAFGLIEQEQDSWGQGRRCRAIRDGESERTRRKARRLPGAGGRQGGDRRMSSKTMP